MILNFKRCSVSGFSLQRVFLSFTGAVAYAIFNVGLYWIPELQVHSKSYRIQSTVQYGGYITVMGFSLYPDIKSA